MTVVQTAGRADFSCEAPGVLIVSFVSSVFSSCHGIASNTYTRYISIPGLLSFTSFPPSLHLIFFPFVYLSPYLSLSIISPLYSIWRFLVASHLSFLPLVPLL